jgi:phage host-nuclease inhibitor protein Gam
MPAPNVDKLKSAYTSAKAARDRAIGRLEAAKSQLRLLGFESLEDAESELTELRAEKARLEDEFSTKHAEFVAEYGPKLREFGYTG